MAAIMVTEKKHFYHFFHLFSYGKQYLCRFILQKYLHVIIMNVLMVKFRKCKSSFKQIFIQWLDSRLLNKLKSSTFLRSYSLSGIYFLQFHKIFLFLIMHKHSTSYMICSSFVVKKETISHIYNSCFWQIMPSKTERNR